MLKLVGELENPMMLCDLKSPYESGDMMAFYATAERVLKMKCDNPMVWSLIMGKVLFTEKKIGGTGHCHVFRRYLPGKGDG